jgi:hypothetical protein
VQMARRGWLEKKDVINTLPLAKLLATLRAKPGEASKGKHHAAAAGAHKKGNSRKSS